jgi:hypothetical protein
MFFGDALAFALWLLVFLGVPLGLVGIGWASQTRHRHPAAWPARLGGVARWGLVIQWSSCLFSLIVVILCVVEKSWRDPYFFWLLLAAAVGNVAIGPVAIPAWMRVGRGIAADAFPRVAPPHEQS